MIFLYTIRPNNKSILYSGVPNNAIVYYYIRIRNGKIFIGMAKMEVDPIACGIYWSLNLGTPTPSSGPGLH